MWKTRRFWRIRCGKNAPQPGNVLRGFQEQRSHDQQHDGRGNHDLGVQGQFSERPLPENIQNDQISQTSEDDQKTGGQIQENVVLVGDQIAQPARISKPELLKAAMEWKMLMPMACSVG